MLRDQDALIAKDTASPTCFFSRLAAFFSLGDSDACFFVSRLDRWDLVMGYSRLCAADAGERSEVELKRVYLGVAASPALLCASTYW
jgi:hypothetical protein